MQKLTKQNLLKVLPTTENKDISPMSDNDKRILLTELCKSQDSTIATSTDRTKYRLFINDSNQLCYLKKGSTKYGYFLESSDLKSLTTVVVNLNLSEEEEKEQKRIILANIIRKYKNEALKATFTNPFIRDVLNADESLSLCKNKLSGGVKIEGKFISTKRMAYVLKHEGEAFLDALKNKTNFHSGRYKMDGYEASVELKLDPETGDFRGWLNREYANCLNGHYYLLLSDENFVGYDID